MRVIRLRVGTWKHIKCQLRAFYPLIVKMIKSRFIYAGHAACTGEKESAHKILVRRSLG